MKFRRRRRALERILRQGIPVPASVAEITVQSTATVDPVMVFGAGTREYVCSAFTCPCVVCGAPVEPADDAWRRWCWGPIDTSTPQQRAWHRACHDGDDQPARGW